MKKIYYITVWDPSNGEKTILSAEDHQYYPQELGLMIAIKQGDFYKVSFYPWDKVISGSVTVPKEEFEG